MAKRKEKYSRSSTPKKTRAERRLERLFTYGSPIIAKGKGSKGEKKSVPVERLSYSQAMKVNKERSNASQVLDAVKHVKEDNLHPDPDERWFLDVSHHDMEEIDDPDSSKKKYEEEIRQYFSKMGRLGAVKSNKKQAQKRLPQLRKERTAINNKLKQKMSPAERKKAKRKLDLIDKKIKKQNKVLKEKHLDSDDVNLVDYEPSYKPKRKIVKEF